MMRIDLAWAVAALTCALCGACGTARVESGAAQQPSAAPRASSPAGPLTASTADPVPSAAPCAVGGCQLLSTADLDGVVARAVSGLHDTTAADGWSRACAWVTASGGSGESNLLTLQIGWQGSLHEYSGMPGASPIVGLADEAYLLDDGSRVALRSGELVAVVNYSGPTALAMTFAQQVAEQLPE